MKVKEMMYWLGKLDPEQEVMCQGDGYHLYSNVIICNKPRIGEVWMFGAKDTIKQIIDIQLKEVSRSSISKEERR